MADNRKQTGLNWLAHAVDGGSQDNFSIIEVIGGPRGVIESIAPGFVFVVLFVWTSDLRVTVVVSGVVALLQVLVRLLQRQSILGAISGLVAVAICLVWAWTSHEARNYYMFGFVTNAIYIVLLSVSLLIRVPAFGFAIEFIRTLPTEHYKVWLHNWLDDRQLRRAYMRVTALWVAVFCVRLLVQVPLYATNHVALLGGARLIMGLPFWALAIWVSYLLVATAMHDHTKGSERNISQTGSGSDTLTAVDESEQ